MVEIYLEDFEKATLAFVKLVKGNGLEGNDDMLKGEKPIPAYTTEYLSDSNFVKNWFLGPLLKLFG